MKSLLREALSEAIEFAEMDLHALTPAGEAMVQRWRDALPAPDVGVGLTRYGLVPLDDASDRMQPCGEGEWVRFEDVAPLIAAARAVPADVKLETTAEERRAWSRLGRSIAARCSRDIDTLTAALAASTARAEEYQEYAEISESRRLALEEANARRAEAEAREKATDAEIAGLREDKERLDWLDNVNIRSNERNGTVYGWKYDINHNRAALTDHNLPAFSVREAIDAARSPDRIAEIRSRSLREQARLKAFDEQFPGERERALAALSGRKPDKEGT